MVYSDCIGRHTICDKIHSVYHGIQQIIIQTSNLLTKDVWAVLSLVTHCDLHTQKMAFILFWSF